MVDKTTETQLEETTKSISKLTESIAKELPKTQSAVFTVKQVIETQQKEAKAAGLQLTKSGELFQNKLNSIVDSLRKAISRN